MEFEGEWCDGAMVRVAVVVVMVVKLFASAV
jgi:hypothetical protein